MLKNILVYLAMIESEIDQLKFEQIYETYIGLIKHVIRKQLINESLHDDAENETLVTIAKNIHKFGEIDDKKTMHLIARIAKCNAINVYKKEARHSNNVPLEDYLKLEAKENEVSIVAELLLTLPENYKNALLLRYYHDFNNDEIAQLLGFSRSKVEQLISRGKKMLRNKIREYEKNGF